MTVSIETAVLTSLLAFVTGFFSNLLTMRKMFAAKADLEDLKNIRIKAWAEHEKVTADLIDHMEKVCEIRRSGCAPLRTTLETIQKDIGELYSIIRLSNGKLERVIGKLESNSSKSRSQEDPL